MAEDRLNIDLDSLTYPLFVIDGKGIKEPISSMPGIFRFSPDRLLEEASKTKERGINKVLLFGTSDKKDECGTGGYRAGNTISKTVKLLKKNIPGITVLTDVCLCAYTSHGHCGILKEQGNIDKKATLSALSSMAVSHAAAGADYVAPSAMAEGQVRAIRQALNKNGYAAVKIMAYSAKFASQFYGPFRDALNSAPRFGDRRQYQLDYTDRKRALKEIADDIREGADIVMVKPALGYLDIIREARDRFKYPLAAYNVSGEYTMVKLSAKAGYCDEKSMVSEIIKSIKRAGADTIITYHARDIATWMSREKA